MTAPHRNVTSAFIHRAGLLAGILAVLAGILGMHVITGGHSMHSPVTLTAAAGAGAGHPHSAAAHVHAEQGVANFESGTWQGVLVPKGTPDAIVQKLNAALIQAIRNPEVRARLAGQGAEVVTMTPTEQDKFFETERGRWAQVVAQAGIKID